MLISLGMKKQFSVSLYTPAVVEAYHDGEALYLSGHVGSGWAPSTFGEGDDAIVVEYNNIMFVAKYDDEGTIDWVQYASAGWGIVATGITTDDLGNVYVAGFHNLGCVMDTSDTDTINVPTYGYDDILVGRIGGEYADDTSGTAIEIIDELYGVTIYPNPADQLSVISYQLSGAKNAVLQVYDLTGKEIFSAILEQTSTEYLLITESFPSGTYLLKITTELVSYSQRLSVVRQTSVRNLNLTTKLICLAWFIKRHLQRNNSRTKTENNEDINFSSGIHHHDKCIAKSTA